MKKIAYIIVAFTFLICCEENPQRYVPTTMILDGDSLNCMSLINNHKFFQVVCRDENNDTTYFEKAVNDSVRSYIWKYPSGKIRAEGFYKDTLQYDVCKRYFESGRLSSYRYYDYVEDSLSENYKKYFSEEGELDSFWFNISLNCDSERFYLDSTYTLEVELTHSMYANDSLSIVCIFDSNYDGVIEEDTIHLYGHIAPYSFKPNIIGRNKLKGYLIELNGSEYGGEREFSFEYQAIEK